MAKDERIGDRRAIDTERSVQDVGVASDVERSGDRGADAYDVISRADAKQRGLKRYFTGEPCLRGHVAERLVSDKKCVKCSGIRRNERIEKRRKTDPEFARKRYRRNHKYIQTRIAKDPEFRERVKVLKDDWRKHNPDAVRDHMKRGRVNLKARKDAVRAAQTLTVITGIPHEAVKMVDGTWQPVPVKSS